MSWLNERSLEEPRARQCRSRRGCPSTATGRKPAPAATPGRRSGTGRADRHRTGLDPDYGRGPTAVRRRAPAGAELHGAGHRNRADASRRHSRSASHHRRHGGCAAGRSGRPGDVERQPAAGRPDARPCGCAGRCARPRPPTRRASRNSSGRKPPRGTVELHRSGESIREIIAFDHYPRRLCRHRCSCRRPPWRSARRRRPSSGSNGSSARSSRCSARCSRAAGRPTPPALPTSRRRPNPRSRRSTSGSTRSSGRWRTSFASRRKTGTSSGP